MVRDGNVISEPPIHAKILAALTTLIAHTACVK
jgi:hypothetical protein